MKSFVYLAPLHMEAGLAQIRSSDVLPYAGGTDLLSQLKDHLLAPRAIVHLRAAHLPDLAAIREAPDGGLVLGTLVTLAELIGNELVRSRYPALSAAAASAATPQLRNAGTLGGNLRQRPRCEYYRHNLPCLLLGGAVCGARAGDHSHHAIFGGSSCISAHPSDPATALLALDARVHMAGPAGTRACSLDDFYRLPTGPNYQFDSVSPDELITAVELPPPLPLQGYFKAMDRATWAFALASLGYNLSLGGGHVQRVRLASAGVAPIPWRLREVEDVLLGSPLDEKVQGRACAALRKAAQPLPGNAYKVDLLEGLLRQALQVLEHFANGTDTL